MTRFTADRSLPGADPGNLHRKHQIKTSWLTLFSHSYPSKAFINGVVNVKEIHWVLVRRGPGDLRALLPVYLFHLNNSDDLTAIYLGPTIPDSDLNLLLTTGGPIPSKFFHVPGKTRGSHAEPRMEHVLPCFRPP